MEAQNVFEYYLIKNTGEPNVPLLMNNDEVDTEGTSFIYLDEYAHIEKPVYLSLNPPVPPKPNLAVDYLSLPSPVFSQKIFEALAPLNIKGYQLVPAIIVEKKRLLFFHKKIEHTGFFIENVYNCIECFDKEKSVYKICSLTHTWDNIQKIVMDKDLLKIPLDERLVFTSKESSRFRFYHKTVVDAIMSVNPVNIKFTSVKDWFEGIQFH